MAEEKQNKSQEVEIIKDRGVFDFLGKKKEEEKPHEEEVIVAEFDNKVKVSDEPETKHGLLHRSNSSSSSSSDEEEEGEKKKKKKKEKKGGGDQKEEDTSIPIERVEVDEAHYPESEEKKGFLDKIKEKLPGQHTSSEYDGEAKDKKGLLDKIKEKLPGYHSKPSEDKEKEIGNTQY
ncbi:Dehydrin ERD10, partial [Mucuna pruriens]